MLLLSIKILVLLMSRYFYRAVEDCGCADVLLRQNKVDQLSLSRRMDAFGPRYKKNRPKTTLLMPAHLYHVLDGFYLRNVEDLLSLRHSGRLPDYLPLCSIEWQYSTALWLMA